MSILKNAFFFIHGHLRADYVMHTQNLLIDLLSFIQGHLKPDPGLQPNIFTNLRMSTLCWSLRLWALRDTSLEEVGILKECPVRFENQRVLFPLLHDGWNPETHRAVYTAILVAAPPKN
jgi:hypothetical protein